MHLVKSLKYALFLGLLAAMLAGCRDFSFNSFLQGEALATVGDKKLYIEELQSLFAGNNLTPADSLKLLQSYVERWVKQQLKVEQAGITTAAERERIEGMVDDYRQSLLLYEYDKKYIDTHLDTLISPEEVVEYYRDHITEFKLNTPLVKGVAIRFPIGFRQEGQMRLMAASRRLQDLVDICIKNNFGYREFSDWTELSEAAVFLPRLSAAESARILTAMPPFEVTQGEYRYFLVLGDVLRPGSEMPLERIVGTIRMRIITRRKQELLAALEENLYRSALAHREATVLIDTVPPADGEQERTPRPAREPHQVVEPARVPVAEPVEAPVVRPAETPVVQPPIRIGETPPAETPAVQPAARPIETPPTETPVAQPVETSAVRPQELIFRDEVVPYGGG